MYKKQLTYKFNFYQRQNGYETNCSRGAVDDRSGTKKMTNISLGIGATTTKNLPMQHIFFRRPIVRRLQLAVVFELIIFRMQHQNMDLHQFSISSQIQHSRLKQNTTQAIVFAFDNFHCIAFTSAVHYLASCQLKSKILQALFITE